jgi:hypothetical protein
LATANVPAASTDGNKDIIVTTTYKTGELDSHIGLGSWAAGTYNSAPGYALGISDYRTSSSLDSHLSNQLSSWLTYYNMFTRAAMFKQTDHAI